MAMHEKNLQLDRLVFFCDAVVAIAITLLVFNLKIDHIAGEHLTFKDLFLPWKNFLAFVLSFLNIAGFWRTHHTFFAYIKKIDERLVLFNTGWLFFIVVLPFSTTLVSAHFFDTPAIFMYSLNTLMIACFQNLIWDYAALKPDYLPEEIDPQTSSRLRLYCNLDMINAALAMGLSFFRPVLAFILLFTKLPMIVIARLFFKANFGGPADRRKK